MKQIELGVKKISRFWKAIVLVIIACVCVFAVTKFASAETVRMEIEGDDLSDGTWQVGSENKVLTAKVYDPESDSYLSLEDGGSISWESSDSQVVSVSQSYEGDTSTATLRALSAGKAVVTATYTKTVTDENGTYDVTTSQQKTVVVKFEINDSSIPSAPFEDDYTVPAITTNSDKPVTWKSSKDSVVTVSDDGSGNGIVSIRGAGKSTITATTDDGQSDSFEMVVNAKYLESTSTVNVNYKEYYVLTTNAKSPSNIVFKSENESIATVGEDGSVYGVNAGVTRIDIFAVDSSDSWYSLLPNPARYITVNVPFGISAESTKAAVGDVIKLTSNIGNGKDTEVNWTSSDTSVATVDTNGNVTALRKGVVTISANVVDEDNFGVSSMQTASVTIEIIDSFCLSESEHILNAGETFDLNAIVTDDTATVTWSSDNSSVATVAVSRTDNKIATVKAVSKGTAVITATQIINGVTKTATCEISVTEPVQEVSITPEILNINVGEQYALIVTFTPERPDNTNVQWVSSNENIIKVNENGVVTAVSGGQAVVSVITDDGIKVASTTVNVRVPVTSLTLDTHKVVTSLSSKSYQMTYHIAPVGDGVNTAVTWTSSNDSVATVNDSGLVNFVSPGNVTIIAKTVDAGTDGNIIDTCEFVINNPVTAIDLDYTSLTLKMDEVFRITAKITPSDATNKTILWTSSDTNVATVDENGLITAVGTGSATILAKSDDSGATSMCNVTVYQPVTSVSMSSTEMTVRKGNTFWLYAKAMPDNAMNKDIEWSTTDSEIATVDETGKVTTLEAGVCSIVATSKDTGVVGKCKLTVQQAVTGIYLNTTEKTIMKDQSFLLVPTVTPSDAENKKVTYVSSDTSVATVDENGVVKGVKGGAAIITAKTEERGLIASCQVTVQEFVSKMSIDSHFGNLKLGTTMQLKYTVGEESATNREVTWSTSDSKIVKVSDKGVISCVGVGIATVYVNSTDGSGMSASVKVSVIKPVTGISLSNGSLSILAGQSAKVTATVSPADATVKGLTWTSSNESVAIVDNTGTITAVSEGSCTITVKATDDYGAKGIINVRVTPIVYATGITINSKSITMMPGQTRPLSARIKPTNTTEGVMWISGDTSVATVSSSGVVTARGQGNTEIYAVSTLTGVETACTVNVLALNATYITLEQYDSYDLDVFGSTETIKWYSNNKRVATVSSSGQVVARMAGTTTITAKVNGKVLYCTVKVKTMK